jgi:hypothetical protein
LKPLNSGGTRKPLRGWQSWSKIGFPGIITSFTEKKQKKNREGVAITGSPTAVSATAVEMCMKIHEIQINTSQS